MTWVELGDLPLDLTVQKGIERERAVEEGLQPKVVLVVQFVYTFNHVTYIYFLCA